MPNCAIKLCRRSSKTSNLTTNGVSFHRFPKCPKQKSQWIKATLRRGGWLPSKYSCICSEHFTDDSFHILKDGRRRLLDTAVPTLYLPALNSMPKNTNDDMILTTSDSGITESVPSRESSPGLKKEDDHPLNQTDVIYNRKHKIDPVPESSSAYRSPIYKRLCRRIVELQNIIRNKNKILRKFNDSNRRLKRKMKMVKTLLEDLDRKSFTPAENKDR